jgi:hypothetical protein
MKLPDLDMEDYPLEDQSTGSHDDIREFRYVTYPFDKYLITVKLSSSNEFLGVIEVRINKQFLSFKQRQPKGYHDVDEFYRE